jgi:hypothetical protein
MQQYRHAAVACPNRQSKKVFPSFLRHFRTFLPTCLARSNCWIDGWMDGLMDVASQGFQKNFLRIAVVVVLI